MKLMKHNHKKIIILSGICLFFCLFCPAQNTTNLPTPMYGIGELNNGEGGRYAGMGNIGIALNRNGFQNTLNPAAITHMDTLCFTFDLGASAAYARYSFLSDNSSSLTGNPNRFSLGFRVLPRWYAMIGASPYSSIGYLIQTEEEIEGDPGAYTYSSFEGTGGLYRCYITNAFALTPQLSVGINLGMVLGTATQSETQESAVVQYESTKKAFYTDLGIYYELADHRQRTWSFGLVFAPSMKISHDNTLTYSNSSTSESLDKSYHSPTQYLPMHIGTGISLHNGHWTTAIDYNYVDWSRNVSSYTSMKYENQHKVNIGGIYATNPRLPRCTEIMGGLGFSNSYINLKNGKMYYLETNIGVSFPIRYSYLSLGATWRKQINSRSNLMQENRFSLNLNLTFGEKISKFKLK